MAVLSNPDRLACYEEFLRERNAAGGGLNLSKVELRACIDATDAWISANAAAFNSALPLPGRTALTAAQKAKMLVAVAEKRFITGA